MRSGLYTLSSSTFARLKEAEMRRASTVLFMMCLCLGQSFGQTAVAFPAPKAERLRHASPAPVWEQVGDKALLKVNWDWRTVLDGWDVRFGPARPGYNGLTEIGIHRITIWIRPAESLDSVTGIIVHELAHAFDDRYLTPALRSKWIAARGLPPDTPWYFPVGRLGSDYLSGAGDFAESASWTLQGPKAGFHSCLGLRLDERQRQLIARGCRGLPPNKTQQALILQWLAELPNTGGN